MSSLEFIDKEIEKIIFKIIEKVEEREKFIGQYAWATVDFLNAEIKYLENDRDTLYQIKTELEAWEVCKTDNSILSVLQTLAKGESINWHRLPEEKQEILKKALEVKDE